MHYCGSFPNTNSCVTTVTSFSDRSFEIKYFWKRREKITRFHVRIISKLFSFQQGSDEAVASILLITETHAVICQEGDKCYNDGFVRTLLVSFLFLGRKIAKIKVKSKWIKYIKFTFLSWWIYILKFRISFRWALAIYFRRFFCSMWFTLQSF